MHKKIMLICPVSINVKQLFELTSFLYVTEKGDNEEKLDREKKDMTEEEKKSKDVDKIEKKDEVYINKCTVTVIV